MKKRPRWAPRAESRATTIGEAVPTYSPNYYRELGMLRSGGGRAINPRSALAFSAVFSAINRISTDSSTLPIHVYRRTKGGKAEHATDDELYELLDFTANGGESSTSRTLQAGMGHTLGWGNGRFEIQWSLSGRRPLGLLLLEPSATKTERNSAGELRYRVDGASDTLPKTHVLHFASIGPDGVSGYSPIHLHRSGISLALNAEQFGLSFYENGAFAAGFLETQKKLNADGRARLRSSFQSLHGGSANAFKVAVLDDGMTFKQAMISPQDAMYLASREFQVLEIARIFNIPPHKIGDYSRANFSNIEAANLDYWTTSIAPWLKIIEDELNLKLIGNTRKFIKFSMQGVLRAASRDRAEFYRQMRDLGAMSPNDIRSLEDMGPIPQGNTYLAPMNMAPLEVIASGKKLRSAVAPDGTRFKFAGDDEPAPRPHLDIKL